MIFVQLGNTQNLPLMVDKKAETKMDYSIQKKKSKSHNPTLKNAIMITVPK
jgi:hypothetical protein